MVLIDHDRDDDFQPDGSLKNCPVTSCEYAKVPESQRPDYVKTRWMGMALLQKLLAVRGVDGLDIGGCDRVDITVAFRWPANLGPDDLGRRVDEYRKRKKVIEVIDLTM